MKLWWGNLVWFVPFVTEPHFVNPVVKWVVKWRCGQENPFVNKAVAIRDSYTTGCTCVHNFGATKMCDGYFSVTSNYDVSASTVVCIFADALNKVRALNIWQICFSWQHLRKIRNTDRQSWDLLVLTWGACKNEFGLNVVYLLAMLHGSKVC